MMILLFLIAQLLHLASDSNAIVGKWQADHMNATIEISQTGESSWKGIIVDAKKQEWIGKTMLDLTNYDTDKKSWKGTLIIPSIGMHIQSTLHIKQDSLVIEGKKMFITKTYTWKKLSEAEPKP